MPTARNASRASWSTVGLNCKDTVDRSKKLRLYCFADRIPLACGDGHRDDVLAYLRHSHRAVARQRIVLATEAQFVNFLLSVFF